MNMSPGILNNSYFAISVHAPVLGPGFDDVGDKFWESIMYLHYFLVCLIKKKDSIVDTKFY